MLRSHPKTNFDLNRQSEALLSGPYPIMQNSRVWRTVFSLLVAMLLQVIWGMSPAHAIDITCNATSIPNFSPVLASTSFPRDAPINSVTQDYPAALTFHCQQDSNADRDIFIIFGATPATLVSGYDDVYTTNVPGVGVRYKLTNAPGTNCETLPATVTSGSKTVTCHELRGSSNPGRDFGIVVSVQFVKTANGTVGALTSIPSLSATASVNNQSNSWPWGNVISGSASGSFASLGCSVVTAAIGVTMPRANKKDLPSVGSTTGDMPLNLNFICDAGVRVYATFSDVNAPSNTDKTLSLTPDSSAQGIGYQILYAGNPIAFGADSAVAGNPNQFPVTSGQTSGGSLGVPLTARYVRIADVVPGSANAAATFTMSYQ